MRASIISAGLALALSVNAHLFISSPEPIEGSAPKDPLDASGSNFPCHGVALPSSGGESMSAGSSQLLAFDTGNGANTAVHGGGSCQISITYETDAAKVKDPKNWFVIYSIEGGCPSNTHQNLDSSYQGPSGTYSGALDCTDPKANGVDCINQFNFTIPKGVKDGHAIMAWTWFNSVGNREMYMNCVNTQLSGGDGSEMSTFPNMFVANLASVNTCPTTQSMDLAFPNPGMYVTTKKPSGAAAQTAITFPMATPTGSGCAGDGGSGSGSGSDSGSSPAAASASALVPASSAYGAPSAAQSAAVSQATGDASGSPPVTITTMATITGAASSAVAPSAATSSAAAAAPPSYGSGSGSDSASGGNETSSSGSGVSSSGSGSGTCSTSGAIVCNGPDQFGLCNGGTVVWQAVAAGTTCSGGQVTKKRSMRHLRKHIDGRRNLYKSGLIDG